MQHLLDELRAELEVLQVVRQLLAEQVLRGRLKVLHDTLELVEHPKCVVAHLVERAVDDVLHERLEHLPMVEVVEEQDGADLRRGNKRKSVEKIEKGFSGNKI